MSANYLTDITNHPALSYDMGFKIGNNNIPDPSVYSGARSNLDTMGERDATGYLHRNMVATKYPLKMEYHNIPWGIIMTLGGYMNTDKFNFTFPNPFAGTVSTIEAYAGDLEFEVTRSIDGIPWLGNLKFSVIQY